MSLNELTSVETAAEPQVLKVAVAYQFDHANPPSEAVLLDAFCSTYDGQLITPEKKLELTKVEPAIGPNGKWCDTYWEKFKQVAKEANFLLALLLPDERDACMVGNLWLELGYWDAYRGPSDVLVVKSGDGRFPSNLGAAEPVEVATAADIYDQLSRFLRIRLESQAVSDELVKNRFDLIARHLPLCERWDEEARIRHYHERDHAMGGRGEALTLLSQSHQRTQFLAEVTAIRSACAALRKALSETAALFPTRTKHSIEHSNLEDVQACLCTLLLAAKALRSALVTSTKASGVMPEEWQSYAIGLLGSICGHCADKQLSEFLRVVESLASFELTRSLLYQEAAVEPNGTNPEDNTQELRKYVEQAQYLSAALEFSDIDTKAAAAVKGFSAHLLSAPSRTPYEAPGELQLLCEKVEDDEHGSAIWMPKARYQVS